MKFQLLCLEAVLVMAFLGCRTGDMPKADALHPAGARVAVGEFLKMEQVQHYDEKVILTTVGRMPMYQRFDSISMIPEAYKAFVGVRVGDTVNYMVRLDSGLVAGKRKLVPNGGQVKVTSVILDILPDEESMVADLDVSKRKLEASKAGKGN